MKSPMIIRAVTNIVLMISDMDILFSVLFAKEVAERSDFWRWGWIVQLVGVLTYFLGVCVFGPRQKFAVIKMVLDLMAKHPDEFKTEKGDVTAASKLSPTKKNGQNGETFGSLQKSLNTDDFNAFKNGMGEWGLIAIWNYCDAKNAKNTTEVKHGTPFLRLARFGFMAEPTPKDLGSILNANAMYTFSTGIFQLILGTLLLVMDGAWRLQMLLPLGISGVSFVLSVFNVVLDFSGILTAIEGERRITERILQQSEGKLNAAKKKAEATRDSELANLEKYYENKRGPADRSEWDKKKEETRFRYESELQDIDEDNVNLLEIELQNYRNRIVRIKQVVTGKRNIKKNTDRLSPNQEFANAKAPLEAVRDRITKRWQEQIDKLNSEVDDMDADDFTRKMEQFTKEKEDKLKAITKQMDDLKGQYRGDGRDIEQGSGDGTKREL